jgi:hypothetical protein
VAGSSSEACSGERGGGESGSSERGTMTQGKARIDENGINVIMGPTGVIYEQQNKLQSKYSFVLDCIRGTATASANPAHNLFSNESRRSHSRSRAQARATLDSLPWVIASSTVSQPSG